MQCRKEAIIDNNILIKVLINGIITWIIVALILVFFNGMAFTQALVAPYAIVAGIAGLVGSYIGYRIKAKR